MEAWHEPYAPAAPGPAAAPQPAAAACLRPVFRRAPVHVMTTDEVHAPWPCRYGEVAAWAREAGYDGIQLASSNAKLIDQFLSPFWNRRDDEFGGSPERRARLLRGHPAAHRRAGRRGLHRHGEGAGGGEGAAVHPPHHVGRGPRPGRAAARSGATTRSRPVEVSVFPDTTLSRGGIPASIWRNKAMQTRFRTRRPPRLRAPWSSGGLRGRRACTAPFRPVWNRSRFVAAKASVSIPVLAVGGIRTAAEVNEILDGGRRRPGRDRPAVLRRARPRRPHPRRRGRRPACASTPTCACRPRCSA